MLPRCVALLFAGAVLLHGVRTQTGASCSDRAVELTLTSYKDTRGRWVAEVAMEHGGEKRDANPWRVDLQHKTLGCDDSPTVKIFLKLTSPPPTPGPGYELHRGLGYYKLHLEEKTWPEAKEICESEGGHLAIINSEAESKVLLEMMKQLPANASGVVFLGFNDIDREGHFLTIFGEPLSKTGFTRWFLPNQPDNSGGSATHPGEDCGSMHRSNGGLNDQPCSSKIQFFCEMA